MLMKRQITSALLLTQWILGLSLMVLFPVKSQAEQEFSKQTVLEIGEHDGNELGTLPESSGFEAESKVLFGNFSLQEYPLTRCFTSQFLNPHYSDSAPLFDVKTTFFYFFHTW